MRFLRALSWLALALVVVCVIGPVLALAPASVVDQGPNGAVRSSLIYLALVAWDPFVWVCVWNSLSVAVVVAFVGWLLGVSLARMVGRWRFWGRGPLALLACAPLAATPLFGAIGVRSVLEQAELGRWAGLAAWLAWVGLSLSWAVPLVMLVSRAALARVDATWEDAARLAGATPRQVWWTVAWPIVRPETARAVAAVFTLTLLEPGAPLVLGLRRTLSYQVVEAALDGPPAAPRAAVLSLGAIAIVALARLLVRWWGRAHWPVPPVAWELRPKRARWLRATAMFLFLAAWVSVALIPTASVLALSLMREGGDSTAIQRSLQAFLQRLRDDPEADRLAANSLALGLAAAVIGLVLALALTALASRNAGRVAAGVRALSSLPDALPPLALGVGALLLPGLLAQAATGLFPGQTPISRSLLHVAEQLDPYQAPGLLLAAVLVMVYLPMLIRATDLGRTALRPRLLDTARSLGASRRRAARSLFGLWFGGAPAGALLVTIALAATALAPALVLALTPTARPIAPAILGLADAPGGGLRRAADWATAAIVLNLTALALASRRRAGPLGNWFRG